MSTHPATSCFLMNLRPPSKAPYIRTVPPLLALALRYANRHPTSSAPASHTCSLEMFLSGLPFYTPR